LISDLPLAVQNAFEEGKCYVSFVYLTDEFVKSPLAKHLNFVHGILQHPMMDQLVREEDLPNSSWERAARRFLDLLSWYWPDLREKWESYYNEHYFGGRITSTDWQWRLLYDMYLREVCLPHSNLWPQDNVKSFKRNARTNAQEKKLDDYPTRGELLLLLQNGRNSESAGPSTTSKRKSSGDDAVAKSDRFREGQGGEEARKTPSPFCFVCGSKAHDNRTCSAATQANGKEINITKTDKGRWTLPDGSSFCYGYNSQGGCKHPKCRYGAHFCTICKSTSHGAFFCKA
jgi:hypothetical protein